LVLEQHPVAHLLNKLEVLAATQLVLDGLPSAVVAVVLGA
jgi:hypothetical protein